MKKLNTVLICIISVGIITMVVMSCFFPEHTLLLYNIRELKRESGVAFAFAITEVEILLITVVAIVVLIFNLTILMHRKKRSILNQIIIGIVAAAGLYVLSFTGIFYLLGTGNKFCFYSPDEKYSIIAYECSFLYAGRVELYERTSPVTVKRIGKLATDDCTTPISHSEYTIRWHENTVEFTISEEGNGVVATEIIELKNAKDS